MTPLVSDINRSSARSFHLSLAGTETLELSHVEKNDRRSKVRQSGRSISTTGREIDIEKSEDPEGKRIAGSLRGWERDGARGVGADGTREARPLGLFAVIGGALTRQTKHWL